MAIDGADIGGMTAAATLRRIGVEERVIHTSFKPYAHLKREWDTGKVMRDEARKPS